jgi:regulator of replication initiation timing
MEAETLPMDFQNKLEVLFQEVTSLDRKVTRLVCQDLRRGHEHDALFALYQGLVSENQALRLRVLDLEERLEKKTAGNQPAVVPG